jgi:hypothetical protein
MKHFLKFAPAFLFCALSAVPSFASGPPVRGSSNNGVDSDAFNWNLMGPTAAIPRHNGTITLQTQIVCTNQSVAAAVTGNTDTTTAGTCLDGNYTFLFQIQTTATSLTATLSNLVGFTADANLPTYGLAVCDNDPNNPAASNTLQLCTQVSGLDISGITATPNKKGAKVVFTIPAIPAFPAGVGKQGQGLTFVIVEQQTGPFIAVPKIAFQ